MKLTDFLIDLGNSVAYYPKLVEVTGGVLPNLFVTVQGVEVRSPKMAARIW